MKNHILSTLAISLITNYFALNTCKAQAPQGIPYQAIARNASGVAISNTAVKVRFSIRDSIATGPVRYQETHSPTTSALGLFSVNVGMGTVVSGTFSGINWGKNAKFLQVELDPAGGTSYTNLGTTQMMSVPYALQANAIKMRTSATGDTLYTGGGNYVIIPGISAANPSTGNPNWNGTTLTDIDGNTYQTVTIGNQIWMKENLKVSRYRNGDLVSSQINSANQTGAYTIFANLQINEVKYGKLYNWYAVVDSRGLCPAGWHVPTDNDWNILGKYLDQASDTICIDCISSQIAGGKMKDVSNWGSPNSGASNSSGFSALPGGLKYNNGVYDWEGCFGYWWTSTEISSCCALNRRLSCVSSALDRYAYGINGDKGHAFSVRCLKDNSAPLQGSINSLDCGSAQIAGTLTSGVPASGVSAQVGYSGGNGGSHSGQTVNSTGVSGLTATLSAGSFASGSGSLNYSISGTPSSSGTASFALSIGGRSCTLSLTVNTAAPNTLTDIDGNVYNTVTIGSQVWMKENLKVSKYRNGDNIPTNLNGSQWVSTTNGAYAIYNDDPINNSLYGKLYNGYAVIDSRGLCPVGWHVPTDREWNILIKTIDSSSDTTCGAGCYNSYVAGAALMGVSALWSSPNSIATNSSGFSGLPGGLRWYDSGSYVGIGQFCRWSSSTQSSPNGLFNRSLDEFQSYVGKGDAINTYGQSVRCLKD